MQRFILLNVSLAGLAHAVKPAAAILDLVDAGDVLVLVPEPENPFDPNAVRVENSDGIKLGYIPAVSAGMVCVLLRNGYDIKADVDAVVPGRGGSFNVTLNLTLPSHL